MHVSKRFFSPIFSAALAFLIAPRVSAQYYTATDLGLLPGALKSNATAINNSGLIVGNGSDLAFSYSGGTMTDLGNLGNGFSEALAVNNSGLIVGDSLAVGHNQHAFSDIGGIMSDLGPISTAAGVNDSGEIVGQNTAAHAVSLAGGVMTDLGTLGGRESAATDVNNSGVVVGWSFTPIKAGNSEQHAFSDTGGVMTDLGTLGGSLSIAESVNNSGEIVGWSFAADGTRHPFSYIGGVMSSLGDDQAAAYSVNSSGEVVGAGYGPFFNDRFTEFAFVDMGLSIVDLNLVTDSLSSDMVSLLWAEGVNDGGNIVGQGVNSSGETVGFLLTPTTTAPKATLSDFLVSDVSNSAYLLIIGMAGIAIAGRFRKTTI